MKKGSFIIAVLLLLLPRISLGTEASPPPQGTHGEEKGISREESRKIAVAKVNGSEITMETVIKMMGRTSARKGHGASAPGDPEGIRKSILDKVILQELAYQEAKSEGVVVEGADVDAGIANAKKNGGGEEEYRKLLEKEGMTEKELRVQIERQLVIERIYAKEVLGKVAVTEQEMKKEYEKEKGSFVTHEKVSVIDVVFFLKLDDVDSLKKAEEIRDRINADSEKNPRKLVPDGTFLVRDLVVQKDKEKEIYEEAKKIKVGEVSGVIRTPSSLNVIKLKEYTPEKQFAFGEVRGMIEKKLMAEARQKRLKEWEIELRKGAKIEIMMTHERKP